MKLNVVLFLLGIMVLNALNISGQSPLKIPYQAVIRNASGSVLVNQPVVIKASVVFNEPTNEPVFSETHSVVSTQTGMISISLGNGQHSVGAINEINWKSGIAYLKIEIDYQNSGTYILVGVSQILSVPYALQSGNSMTLFQGSAGQIITHDGNVWQANDKVWVNTQGVVINGLENQDPLNSIFSIKNSAGESLFNVNEQGVEVNLQDNGENNGTVEVIGRTAQNSYLILTPDSAKIQFNTDISKAEKGGFAIGGLSNGKPITTPYLMLKPASVQLSFNKLAAIKAEKGGFAIGGLSNGKTVNNIFTIEPDSTRFYMDTTDQRAEKGGFAIGGLSNGKPISAEFFRLTNVGVEMKFDETEGRAEKGGFAIGGLSNGKTVATDFLALSELKTRISMVDATGKGDFGGLGIGGYEGNGDDYESFFNLTPTGTNINTGSTTTAGGVISSGDINITGIVIFKPQVTTDSIFDITPYTALAHGFLLWDGGATVTKHGFVWDTVANPSWTQNIGKSVLTDTVFDYYNCTLENLEPSTHYYVRAFAKNSAGYAYGETIEITTAEYPFVGSGTVEDPYQITSLTDLKYLSRYSHRWDKHYIQLADIDLTIAESWNQGRGWWPVGSLATPFTGTYDGQGHIIQNLIMNRPGGDYLGFFGIISNANIQNLKIVDITVMGANNLGAIVGQMTSSNIRNCSSTGILNGNDNIGGISGMQSVGSLIANCYSITGVNGNVNIGGLVGESNGSSISNCYARGQVSGNNVGGGLVGNIQNSEVFKCYSTGLVSVTAQAGGLIGSQNSSAVTNSFWNKETSNLESSAGGIGVSNIAMKLYNTFAEGFWDFIGEVNNGNNDIWGINPSVNQGFPFLVWETHSSVCAVSTGVAKNVRAQRASVFGDLLNVGSPSIVQYGHCWSINPNPTIDDNKTELGGAYSPATYISALTNLMELTHYYVRAYAINDVAIQYGEEIEFTTKSLSELLPEVFIDSIGSIIDHLALGYANIVTHDSIVYSQGFVWNTTGNPDYDISPKVEDSYILDSDSYSLEISDLEPNTTYYIKAFVTHNYGESYSDEYTFTTLAAPSVITDFVVDITDITANAQLTLTVPDGVEAINYGFLWDIVSNPTWEGHYFDATSNTYSGQGVYTNSINLNPNTHYYIRSYVTGSSGNYYGNEIEFTTLNSPSVTTEGMELISNSFAKAKLTINILEGTTAFHFGYVWNTSPNVDFEPDNFIGSTYNETPENGLFVDSLYDLIPQTQYYARSYILHAGGYSYGDEISFITSPNPSVMTDSVPNISSDSAQVYGTITIPENTSAIKVGFIWGSDETVSFSNYINSTETYEFVSGSFQDTIYDLEPATQYYVRSYVEQSNYTISYGNVISFESESLPPVVIHTVDAITYNSAWSSATINNYSAEMLTYGFVWSSTIMPDLDNNTGFTREAFVAALSDFNQELSGLTPSTTYQLRGFITYDNDTVYSEVYEFTTSPSPIITNPVEEPTAEGAFVIGWVDTNEGVYADFGGFVWGTEPTIDLTNNIDSVQLEYFNSFGFDYLISGLDPEQSYYVRAWAFIDGVVYYGNAEPFTTKAIYGTVNDASGNQYPTKYIGRYNWMTVNLRTGKYSDGTDISQDDSRDAYWPDSLERFGLLYSMTAISNHLSNTPNSKICPMGWRLPEYNDWQNLIATTEFEQWSAAPHLKAVSEAWITGEGSQPLNTTGFSALPAGNFVIENPPGSYDDAGQNAYFWSQPYGENVYFSDVLLLSNSNDEALFQNYNPELPPVYLSVRCVKTVYHLPDIYSGTVPVATHDAVMFEFDISNTGYSEIGQMGLVVGTEENPTIETHIGITNKSLKMGPQREFIDGLNPETFYYIRAYATNEKGTVYTTSTGFYTEKDSSIFDNSGNKYPIVTIGDQVWMASNLKNEYYNNGDYINTDYEGYPFRIHYPYETPNGENYGLLYQHGVITDPRGICPNGWEIPRDTDWYTLTAELGLLSNVARILKNDSIDAANGFWESSATPGIDSVGFNALPSGYYSEGSIQEISQSAYFWSRFQWTESEALYLKLTHDSDEMFVFGTQVTDAMSVRCIKTNPDIVYHPNVFTGEIEIITPTELNVYGILVDDGNGQILKHGICYGTAVEPDTSGTKIELGTQISDFKANISGLTPNEIYYFRAYTENEYQVSYGQQEYIQMPSYEIPIVSATIPGNITTSEIEVYSSIDFDGYSPISEMGFVWSTSPNPEVESADSLQIPVKMGEITTIISGLMPGMTYYVRAFAINAQGTGYGGEYSFTTPYFAGAGTLEDPYQIFTLNSLVYLSETPDLWASHFIQMVDIDAQETSGMNSGGGFLPIGNDVSGFMGSYNGNGKQINNLFIDRTASQYVGMFGSVNGATLKGITLTDVTLTGGSYSGAIVGASNNANIDSCFVKGQINGSGENIGGVVGYSSSSVMENLSFEGTINGWLKTGGIFGISNHDTVRYCRANAIIVATGNAGAIIGKAENYTFIEQCYSHGSVTETNMGHAGGIAGQMVDGTIQNSYSNANVSGTSWVGGLIGTVSGSFGKINYCYSTGQVTGTSDVSGLIGINSGTITNSYWDVDASGNQYEVGGDVGLTNEEMKLQSSFVNFDFALVWTIENGVSYPYLQWQAAPSEHNYSTIIKDLDGNVYHTTKIGDQEWFTSNLKTTKLNTGAPILNITDNTEWTNTANPAFAYYENNTIYEQLYGAMYNSYAVETGNLCPTGWHVPTDNEWYILENYVDNTINDPNATTWRGTDAAVKLKTTEGWSNSGNGENTFNLNIAPGGIRTNYDGTFIGLSDYSQWWTATSFESQPTTHTWGRLFQYNNQGIYKNAYSKKYGFYVRCIKNTGKFSGGNGTLSNPYIINSFNDLVELAQSPDTWNKHFLQNTNIDASASSTMFNGSGWLPIGNTATPFTGNYSGEGHLITNLYMYRDGTSYTGLFGMCDNATISNLVLSDVNFTAGSTLGGISGSIGNTVIQNCATTGSINGNGFMGGIAGYCSNSQIINSYSAANIFASGTDVGGLVGKSENNSVIENCYATGEVNAGDYVGGLVGRNAVSTIANCYSLGVVMQVTTHGGLVSTNTGTITNSYWNRTSSGVSTSAGGLGLINIKFAKQKTFEGWDFTNDWVIDEFVTYPHLQWQGGSATHNIPSSFPFDYVEDADLNKYGIILMGTHSWMDDNLRTTKYTDGTSIPEETNNATWNALNTGARCWYNNDSSSNAGNYGSLYNFFAIDPTTNGGKALCPTGWHAATDTDWTSLISFLSTEGHELNEGTVLKAPKGWGAGNGSDNYGFEAYPGGLREGSGGAFTGIGVEAFWWSSELGGSDAYYLSISGSGYMSNVDSKYTGRSVRCVQDY